METPRRLILLLFAVLLLPACTSLMPRGQQLDDVAALLAYNQRIARLSAEEQRQEFAADQQAFAGEASEMNRLRLALAWCVPNAAWRDDGRLLKLLEDSASLKTEESSPLRQLTLLLYQEVSERRQEDQRLEAALRDERRRHETQLREEKRHAEELQGKLDGLMEIEREFSRRQRQKAAPR
jgi:hypothetical protein